jgi:hypothetical protein
VDVVVDSADSSGRILFLEVFASSVFEFHGRSSFVASVSKKGIQRRVSMSVLNKFIIGKEVFNALATTMDRKS